MIKYRIKVLVGSMFSSDKRWVYAYDVNKVTPDNVTECEDVAKKFTQVDVDIFKRNNPGITIMSFPVIERKSELEYFVDYLRKNGLGKFYDDYVKKL